MKNAYKSLKKCFYYNEAKKELETDGIKIDENYEFNGQKYIKCTSKHLTTFTAGTYNFNSNLSLWAVLLIIFAILILLIGFVIIFIIIKKRKKSRVNEGIINSNFDKKRENLLY